MIEYKTILTPRLVIAYEEDGRIDGPPVILLHGWPDDVRTWDRIRPALVQVGLRLLIPYLRGFGPTHFRSAKTMRSGQLTALAQDILDFADALGLERFSLVGHDWGARAAYILSAIVPSRVARCVALSVGWGTNTPEQPLSLRQARNYWYQWYMALERGAIAVQQDGIAFAHFLWETWGPPGWFTDDEFFVTARSFMNPDWPTITLHSYRHRWGLVPGDSAYADLEAKLTPLPSIPVPTLVLHGALDTCNDLETSAGKERFFSSGYQRLVLDGVGHFPQREAPELVTAAVVPFLTQGMTN